jgi:hypothetical protein
MYWRAEDHHRVFGRLKITSGFSVDEGGYLKICRGSLLRVITEDPFV